MNDSGVAGNRQDAAPAACSPSLGPEAAAVIGAWRSASLDAGRRAELAAVMPHVREWVGAAGPASASTARQMMWAAAPMAVWLWEMSGSLDSGMLNCRNVEVWVNSVNSHQTNGWRHLARVCLRRIGRAVNPDGWPQTTSISQRPVAPPYSPETEAVLRQSAGLPRQGDRAGRLWVAAGGCGAGLSGVELHAAETGDLRELGDGRLAVQVRGHRARLVPVRSCWTGTVREAARVAQQRDGRSAGIRFVRARGKNAVSQIAAGLDFGQGGLSLRRARTTWLTAHLLAGTPYHALRAIAGSLSAKTLGELVELAVEQIDAEQAVIEGLRA